MAFTKLLLYVTALVLVTVCVECQIECPPYDPVPFMCCNGTVNYKPNLTPRTCCGTKAIASPISMCCQLIINPRPTDPAVEAGCCGPMLQDKNTQTCCQVTLQPIFGTIENTGCCQAKSYERSTQMCCDQHVNEIPPNPRCCGRFAMNEVEQKCCDGFPMPAGLPCPSPPVAKPIEPESEEEVKVVPHKKGHKGRKHRKVNH